MAVWEPEDLSQSKSSGKPIQIRYIYRTVTSRNRNTAPNPRFDRRTEVSIAASFNHALIQWGHQLPLPQSAFIHTLLTGLDSRTRRGITLGDRIVNINHNARIRRRISARKRHLILRRKRAAPATNTDLRTRDVELRPARRPGAVQADVLGPEQVLPVGQALGEGDADALGPLGGPAHPPRGDVGHVLVDLAPDLGRAWLPGRDGLAGGDLCDVEGHGARVGDGGLGVVGHGLAGGHVHYAGGVLHLVAADVGGLDVGHGAVALVVLCLANDLPVPCRADAGECVCTFVSGGADVT